MKATMTETDIARLLSGPDRCKLCGRWCQCDYDKSLGEIGRCDFLSSDPGWREEFATIEQYRDGQKIYPLDTEIRTVDSFVCQAFIKK